MNTDAFGALKSLRILDLSQGVAGSSCTKLMAGFGAEVIKVESPGDGDSIRSMGPFWHDEKNVETGCLFLHLSASKKSVTLDITKPEGSELLRRLVPQVNAVIESYEPGFMEEHGLGYDTLRTLNPSLVMTSITPFGQTGPYSKWKASELISYAVGGYAHLTGLPEREPLKSYGHIIEYHTGVHAAVATLGALWRSSLTGISDYIDVSIQAATAYVVDQPPLRYRRTGKLEARVGSRNSSAQPPPGYFSELLPCVDGYMHVHSSTSRAKPTSISDLIGDPKWNDYTNEGLPPGKDVISEYLAPWLLDKTREDMLWKAQAVSAPWGSVLKVDEVPSDPQHVERGYFGEVDHPVVGKVRQPGFPFIMRDTPWQMGRPPLLGEHNDQVFGQFLQIDKDEIEHLRERGVV
jgi:CoA:oxalate CoA-transferase